LIFLQRTALQAEADRLSDEKPEEAKAIREKIAQINELWLDLKQKVTQIFFKNFSLVK